MGCFFRKKVAVVAVVANPGAWGIRPSFFQKTDQILPDRGGTNTRSVQEISVVPRWISGRICLVFEQFLKNRRAAGTFLVTAE